ncbi:hypothetical protein [Ammoniphilus sp. CFH 90114]|uniref:hypothetical protein n=1 Tax=Ammoniphilus sp. CFH 90114 TaxID=2493665 RepID=UPI00100E2F83|nr:hypothetical protein [Ammoniphilus sp. CFH 90114]
MSESSTRSRAYWRLYEVTEQWKKGFGASPVEGETEFQVEVIERYISPRVMEGEIRVSWNSRKGVKEWKGFAYRMVSP